MSLATFSRIFLWEIIGYFWYESLENKITLKIMLFLFNLPNFKNCFYKIYPFLSIFLHGSDLQLSILSKITPLKKPFVAKTKTKHNLVKCVISVDWQLNNRKDKVLPSESFVHQQVMLVVYNSQTKNLSKNFF